MISNIQPGMIGVTPPPAGGMQDAVKDLARSLRKGDLDGAKQAYADVIRQAPEGASWPKGSAFADVGRALANGDVEAAKQTFAQAMREKLGIGTPGEPVSPPIARPEPAPSGPLAGGRLHVVA